MRCIFPIILVNIILQCFFLSSTAVSVAGESAGDPALYYFNPDSAQSNLGRLKLEMDSFFDRSGYSVGFQAFSYQSDLDLKIHEQQPQFLFIPEWYYKKYGQKLKIKPFLMPVAMGLKTFRKVLLVSKTSKITMDSIENRSIAMTTMGPDSEKALSRILFPDKVVKESALNPVIVPKGTDALFALTLGQVDLALVVKEHMKNFERFLPVIVDSVRPLAMSKPIPMAMLCYSEELVDQADILKFKNIFLSNDNKKTRNQVMELLQIDEWQETSN